MKNVLIIVSTCNICKKTVTRFNVADGNCISCSIDGTNIPYYDYALMTLELDSEVNDLIERYQSFFCEGVELEDPVIRIPYHAIQKLELIQNTFTIESDDLLDSDYGDIEEVTLDF